MNPKQLYTCLLGYSVSSSWKSGDLKLDIINILVIPHSKLFTQWPHIYVKQEEGNDQEEVVSWISPLYQHKLRLTLEEAGEPTHYQATQSQLQSCSSRILWSMESHWEVKKNKAEHVTLIVLPPEIIQDVTMPSLPHIPAWMLTSIIPDHKICSDQT